MYIVWDRNERKVVEVSENWRQEYLDGTKYWIVDTRHDKLENIFKMQEMLQDRLNSLVAWQDSNTELVIKNRLCLCDELSELCNELDGYKTWKHYDKRFKVDHRSAVIEEFADCMHFFINIALALGLNFEDCYRAYIDKWLKNNTRQDNGY